MLNTFFFFFFFFLQKCGHSSALLNVDSTFEFLEWKNEWMIKWMKVRNYKELKTEIFNK